jgi:hypothetical protein
MRCFPGAQSTATTRWPKIGDQPPVSYGFLLGFDGDVFFTARPDRVRVGRLRPYLMANNWRPVQNMFPSFGPIGHSGHRFSGQNKMRAKILCIEFNAFASRDRPARPLAATGHPPKPTQYKRPVSMRWIPGAQSTATTRWPKIVTNTSVSYRLYMDFNGSGMFAARFDQVRVGRLRPYLICDNCRPIVVASGGQLSGTPSGAYWPHRQPNTKQME